MTCDFCYRECALEEGRTGACGVRTMRNGMLQDSSYGALVSLAVDPVEKKPLYHFLPRSQTVSIAMSGCNLSCEFCQNWQIAQEHSVHGNFTAPEDIVLYTKEHRYPSISYTYSEPLVWQDYMLEVARLARSEGVLNIMVSNGTFSPASLDRILPLIDAYNIDLKGDERFYREICHGSVEPVLRGLEAIARHDSHLEVTTMLIEGIHTVEMVHQLGRWLFDCGVQVWHLSRFFPRYHMSDRQETSEHILNGMMTTAREAGIPFVYPGNSMLSADTICPQCGATLRTLPRGFAEGFDGRCPSCGATIYGVWSVS